MKDCFNLSLAGEVNGDIPVLGELRIRVKSGASGSNNYISYSSTAEFPQLIKVIGEGTLNAGGDKELIVNSQTAQFIATSSDILLSVSGKYGLDRLKLAQSEINLEDVQYCVKLTSLCSFYGTGNLKCLKNLTKLNSIEFNSSSVYGELHELSVLSKVTYININDCVSIYGTAESFIENMLENRDMSIPNLRLIAGGSNCTFHGNVMPSNLYITFASATSVLVGSSDGASDIATYNNGVWTYV